MGPKIKYSDRNEIPRRPGETNGKIIVDQLLPPNNFKENEDPFNENILYNCLMCETHFTTKFQVMNHFIDHQDNISESMRIAYVKLFGEEPKNVVVQSDNFMDTPYQRKSKKQDKKK